MSASAPWRAVVAALATFAAAAPAPAPGAGRASPPCTGGYADAISAMRADARAREASGTAPWVYCLRATAVYEHLAYGRGGRVRRQYVRKVRHGTGFGYASGAGRWLLATNEHVVSFPEVTLRDGDVDGVPAGARKVGESVRIVQSEAEPDGPDQPVLARVVSDEALDIAVLASRAPLRVAPYRFGRSADLRVGDAVLVRGFPLGAFPAANEGRVIGTGLRDLERGWDHVDFAVDALLNPGSSGSPVLAVSCRTGEPEIVGLYHAGYKGAQGLHVVVGIDEVRGVLEGLRAPVRRLPVDAPPDRAALRAWLERAGAAWMPFGGRAVRALATADGVRFEVLSEMFPLSARVEVVLVDRGGTGAAVALPRVLGAAEVPWPALRGDAAARTAELRDALWAQLAAVVRFRSAEERGDVDAQATLSRVSAALHEREDDQGDLLAAVDAQVDAIAAASTKRESGPPAATPARGSASIRTGGSGSGF